MWNLEMYLLKLQQYTGNKLLVDKLDELNPGTDKRLVSRETYQRLLQDPEIKNKILTSPKVTDEELYSMGIKTLPEVVTSTTIKSAESGFSYIGEKVSNGTQSLGNKFKDGFESFKTIFIPGKSEPFSNNFPSQDESKWIDMSDEDFNKRQADIPENSPGKKAVKDQDLIDTRHRGLGKDKKT